MKKFAAILILAVLSATALVAFKASETTTGVTLIVTHEVKDFATWKKGFDNDEPNRKKAGFMLQAVYTSVEKPNEVTIIFTAPSTEAVNGMLSDPQLKMNMEKAGVISRPEAKILNKR
ncbi:MAG: hypothetical protein V4616_06150 [Bacteroidota bacterium]